MSNIFTYVIFVLEAVLGVGSSLYIIVSLFGTLGYKLFRCIKYKMSITD